MREQLAGDELAGLRARRRRHAARWSSRSTATHFLRNAPDGTGESDGNPDEVRIDRFTVLEGNVQNAHELPARPHHPVRPLPRPQVRADHARRSTIGLQAIFFPGVQPGALDKPNDRVVHGRHAGRARDERQRHDRADRPPDQGRCETGLARSPSRSASSSSTSGSRTSTPAARRRSLKAVRTPEEEADAGAGALLKKHAQGGRDQRRRPGEAVPRVRRALRERGQARRSPSARRTGRRRSEKLAVVRRDRPEPAGRTTCCNRGQHDQPGAEVQPGVPAALGTAEQRLRDRAAAAGPGHRPAGGRRSPSWVTSPENPLFARVMVNRVWQHHFGTGLVGHARQPRAIRGEAVAPGVARLPGRGVRALAAGA